MKRPTSYLFALALGLADFAHAEGRLEVELKEVEQSHRANQQGLPISVTFKNAGDRPIELSSSYIPSDKDEVINGNLFRVDSELGSAAFTGIYVHNIAGSDQKKTLAPGQEVTRVLDLAKSYEIKARRRYSISVRPLIRYFDATSLKNVSPDGSRTDTKTANSNTLDVTSGTLDEAYREEGRHHLGKADSACSTSQYHEIDDSILNASALSMQAVTYTQSLLQVQPDATLIFSQTPRYTKWYGAYGDPNDFTNPNGLVNGKIAWRLAVNAIRLGKIPGQLPNPPVISTTCSCEKSGNVDPDKTIAWVAPNAPYRINICPIFFQLPDIGGQGIVDSKAGTILHEISHFNDGYTTGTYDLGDTSNPVSEAKFMATFGRELAADNAYSIEYYGINLESDL